MAEMIIPQKQGRNTRLASSIHVDMTPMVDLGFLLITFFMLVSHFSQPKVMDLSLPAKETVKGGEIDFRNQITFIVGQNDQVFYYQKDSKELSKEDIHITGFNSLDIAKLITEKRKLAPKPNIFTVIVKPSEGSSYQNLVDILDEIAISQNLRYGLTELNKKEEDMLKMH